MNRICLAIFCSLISMPALAQTPNDSASQAAALYQQGQYAQAAQVYRSGLQADPQSWQLYQGLGTCLYQLHQLPEALQAYDSSLALHADNPQLKAFADALRAQLGPAAPAAASPAVESTPAAASNPAPGGDEERQAVAEFNKGKQLEREGQDILRKLDAQHQLTLDDTYLARWGAPKSSFYDPHFTLDFGLLTPTAANLDLGFFLDPTTNLGIALCYVPLSYSDYYTYDPVSETDIYDPYSIPGDLIYLEPRIKFYSAPSGLTSYQGFSFIYYGLHQGVDREGYQSTSFDIFGLGYMFGFRTLPMDGMTMELGWKVGAAVIIAHSSEDVYNSSTGGYTYVPTTTTVPFPYIIPEFRFGFTF